MEHGGNQVFDDKNLRTKRHPTSYILKSPASKSAWKDRTNFSGAKAKLNFPLGEEKTRNPLKRGNCNESPSPSSPTPRPPSNFSSWKEVELIMNPENKVMIFDFMEFLREREAYKKAGKARKRLYLLYNPPGTDRSRLVAAMADYLPFDDYNQLDVSYSTNSISSAKLELTNKRVLASFGKRSLIHIEHRGGTLPDINAAKLEGSCLLKFVDGLSLSCGDRQIIVFDTNSRDLHAAALQRPSNEYMYIHKSSPQPLVALPDFQDTKAKLYFPPVEQKIRNPEMKKKANRNPSPSPCPSSCSTVTPVGSSSREGLEELGMDLENKDIISDFLTFVDHKETYKRFDSWKRLYLLYNPPGTDRSRLIAAMANYLQFRIHNLDVTSFSSLSDIPNMLASIPKRSLIWIQDSAQCATPGMLPDLNTIENNLEMEMRNWFPDDFSRQRAPPVELPPMDQPHPSSSSSCLTSASKGQAQVEITCRKITSESVDSGESSKRPAAKDEKGGTRREITSEPCVKVSSTMVADGHAWRKYGQKEILNAQFPRCYFRCTHRLDNRCLARKQVQRIQEEPPLYQSTYFDHHTCRSCPNNDHHGPQNPSLLDSDPVESDLINESFQALRSLLPPGTKQDKASVLASTTDYLASLKAQVEELSKRSRDLEEKGQPLATKREANQELRCSYLKEFVDRLWSSCDDGDARIIVFSTNNRDLHNSAQRCLKANRCLRIFPPSPEALPAEGEIANGGEIVDEGEIVGEGESMQLYSVEQKPPEDFDATNDGAHQSSVSVPNPEKKNTREASNGQCMTEGVLNVVDPTTKISSMDFDAPDNDANLLRAHQGSPIVLNSEKKDTIDGVGGECLTKSVLGMDDSGKQEPLLDFDATENKAYLSRADQIASVLSLSENKYSEASESNITSILGSEDLQQHCSDSSDAAAKIFCHGGATTVKTEGKSSEVLETLPTKEQPIDCVQQEKTPYLPRGMQINGVEQRVTKMPRDLGELTTQSASSSGWPLGLPDEGHIVLLHPLDQSTENIEHVARADQCSPLVFLAEKKMVRKTLKRKRGMMNVMFEGNHQHFGRRCASAAKSLGAMRICRKHGINQASMLKWIYKQHVHQWPFRQNQATRNRSSMGDERPFKVSRLSMDEKLDSRLQFINMSQFDRYSPPALALPDRGEIVKPTALKASVFAATNNRAQLVAQDDSGSTASHYQRKNIRETPDKQGLTMSLCTVDDLEQHFGCKPKDAVESLGAIYDPAAHTTYSSAQNLFEVLESLVPQEQLRNAINTEREGQAAISSDWPISLPDGAQMVLLDPSEQPIKNKAHMFGAATTSLSEEKMVRTLKRKSRTVSLIIENHQQLQSIALPNGGELGSSAKKPVINFNATTDRAYESGILVSYSEETSTREVSKRLRMTESVISFGDSSTRTSSAGFDAADGRAHLDFHSTENEAHLSRAYQSCPVVSLSAHKNRGDLSKRKCITKSMLRSGDLQKHCGGRRDAAAKKFGDSLALKLFEVQETLLPLEKPRNATDTDLGRQFQTQIHEGPSDAFGLELKGWEKLEKSPYFPKFLLIDAVEQGLTKLPRYSGRSTSQPVSSSQWPIGLRDGENAVLVDPLHWPIDLLDGGNAMLVDPLEQSTKNVANAAKVDLWSPAGLLPKKKMVRESLQRECKTMAVDFEDHRQYFGRRCEGTAKILSATSISRKHWVNWLSTVKRIHKPHWIHCWPLQQISKNTSKNHIHVKHDKSGSTPSNYEGGNAGETSDGQGIAMSLCSVENLQQHFSSKRKDSVNRLGVKTTMFKSTNRKNWVYEQPCEIKNKVVRRPDPHGESNPSTMFKMLSNGKMTMENDLGGQNPEPNEFQQDSFEDLSFSNTENGSMAGMDYLNAAQPQIESREMLNENKESSEDWRNFVASQAEVLLEGHVSESSDLAFLAFSDARAPSQLVDTILHTMPTIAHMIPQLTGSSSETFQGEGQSMHSTAYAKLNPIVFPPHESVNMGNSEYWRASEQECLLEGYVSTSINSTVTTCLGPSLSQQSMPTTPYKMLKIPHTMPRLTASQDTSFVQMMTTYEDTLTEFQLPLTYRIIELKEEAAMRLKLELDSFNVKYKDEEGEWILLPCDEDLRNCLQIFSSVVNRVIKLLVVNKDANPTIVDPMDKQLVKFGKSGMDRDYVGIISNLLRYLSKKEFYKNSGKAWMRFYLLYEPPGFDRSSFIATIVNCLKFDIFDLVLKSMSSILDLKNMLLSTMNCSLIVIQDFDHRSLKNELTVSCLFKYVAGLFSRCGDERIIVLTTKHPDRYDDPLRPLANMDIYVPASLPQPVASSDGGENLQLESLELVDFDNKNNRAGNGETLVRAYISSPIMYNSEKNDAREKLHGECLNKACLSGHADSILELSLQHDGGTHDDAAKSSSAIHTTFSLPRKSSEIQETLLTGEQPYDWVPLLSLGRLSPEGSVKEEKSPDLPRVMQIEGVEHTATKFPIYFGGLTVQSASSSCWSIESPDRAPLVLLQPVEQSTIYVARLARADQCSPTVALPKKEMFGRTLKRKRRFMSTTSEIHQKHFGRPCKGSAKNFGAMRICRKHGINRVSTVKRIHDPYGIRQWPFRQKWATRKGYSLGDKKPSEVSSLSMDEILGSRFPFVDTSQYSSGFVSHELPGSLQMKSFGELTRQSASDLPDGGHVLSLFEKKLMRRTLKRKCRTMSVCLEDHQRHGDKRWDDNVKSLGAKRICRQLVLHRPSSAKCTHEQHGIYRQPSQQDQATMKGYSLEGQRPVEVISLSMGWKLVSRLQIICFSWRVRYSPQPSALPGAGGIVGCIALSSSEFVPTNNQADLTRQDQRGSTPSSSENNRAREIANGRGLNSDIRLEDLRRCFGRKRKDAAESLGVSESTLKRICRRYGIDRWPNRIGSRAGIPPEPPPDPHQRSTSATWQRISSLGQIQVEDPMLGHFVGPNEHPIYWGDESSVAGIRETPVSIDACDVDMDFFFSSIPQETREARGSHGEVFQQRDPPTPSAPPSEGHGLGSSYGFMPACSNPTLTQPISTVSLPAPTTPHMIHPPTPSQDTSVIIVKAEYKDDIISFELPLTSGIAELKDEVAMGLDLRQDSFKLKYRDDDGDFILIACDKALRTYLQPFSLLTKPKIRLYVVDKFVERN